MLNSGPGLRGVVTTIALAASIGACANVLGLDAGVPEDDDSPGAALEGGTGLRSEASAPQIDGAGSEDEPGDENAAAPPPGGSDGGQDAAIDAAHDAAAAGHSDAAAQDAAEEPASDATNGADVAPEGGGCLPALQPCTLGTQCCSGVCSLALACL